MQLSNEDLRVVAGGLRRAVENKLWVDASDREDADRVCARIEAYLRWRQLEDANRG